MICHVRLISLRGLLFSQGIRGDVDLGQWGGQGGDWEERGRRNCGWDIIYKRGKINFKILYIRKKERKRKKKSIFSHGYVPGIMWKCSWVQCSNRLQETDWYGDPWRPNIFLTHSLFHSFPSGKGQICTGISEGRIILCLLCEEAF